MAARALLVPTLLAVWFAAAIVGLVLVERWTITAATPAPVAPMWPQDSGLAAPAHGPVLLMFAHPRCPCTTASVHELARMRLALPPDADVRVLFGAPAAAPGWESSALWHETAAIPGITVIVDPDGREAARFGVTTSGHVLVFGAEGRLRFSGGITSARGHEGDNRGAAAAVAAFVGGELDEAAVFGCETLHGGVP